MKYIFTLLLFLSFQCAQAQLGMYVNGARNVAKLAAHHKAAKPKTKELTATPAPARGVTPFTYQGQAVPCKRTAEAAFKGKGKTEILELEAMLEQLHTAMLADSAASFLLPTQVEAIVAADRKAVAARPDWNYAPYRQELAFYKKEEARRQQATPPAPASTK